MSSKAIGISELGKSCFSFVPSKLFTHAAAFNSTVALTQLFISSRSSLDQIQVRGDMLITAANANSEFCLNIALQWSD